MFSVFKTGLCNGGVILGAIVLAVMTTPAMAKDYVARMSFHWSPNHFSAVHAQKFADEVKARSNGRLTIEVFPSGQLFGVREIMGAVSAGSVEFGGILGVVSFPPINKNYNVANFPGLFKSYEQQRAFFTDTPAGRAVWQDLAKKTNSRIVMYDPVGPVMTFSAARKLDSVKAMNGLKARRLFQIEGPLWSALDVDAVSMPTREVYTSLQTGLIDTVNSPPIGVKAYSWWEYVKYAQLPYQSFADAYIAANATWFDGLPADLQKLVLKIGAEVGAEATALIMSEAQDIIGEFQNNGGTVTTLKGQEKAEFDNLMETKVIPATAKLIDPDVLAAARAYVSR